MRNLLIVGAAIFLLAGNLFAQQPPARLKVGIFEKPPFAMKDDDGKWTGLGVSVWERISQKLNLSFDYVEMPEDRLLEQLAKGEVDLVAGELAVSADRRRLVDFTQPYVVSPAAVVFKSGGQLPHVSSFIEEFVRHGLLPVVLAMMGTLLVFSFLLWMAERRVHQSHFGGRPIHGFGSALWFAAVTMTTVGYGDKTPQSLIGRTLAFFWMFFGILIVGAFTATVASSAAISRVNSTVHGINDLAHFRNGVMEGSFAQTQLSSLGIPSRSYDTVELGLKALANNEITAFVGNEVTLRYVLNQNFPGGQMTVQPFPSIHVSFAFALRKNFPLIDPIEVALLEQTENPDWQSRVQKWTGPLDSN